MRQQPAPLYLLTGLRLLGTPGIRRYVVVPLLINIVIFGALGWWLTSMVTAWLAPELSVNAGGWLASTFATLRQVAAWIVLVVMWLALAWLYTLLANIIGAPFNGLLAERVEAHLDGRLREANAAPVGAEIVALAREIPRMLASEVAKLWYLASRFLPLLLLSFIPGVNIVAPVLMFLFSAWVFALEYLDYPMGNHGARFRDVRRSAGEGRITSLSFGAVVATASSIPIINLVVMPAAVAGATALWLEHWRPQET